MCKKELGKFAKVKRQQDTWYNGGAFSSNGICVTMIVILSTFPLIPGTQHGPIITHFEDLWVIVICTTTAGHMANGGLQVFGLALLTFRSFRFSSVPYGFFFEIPKF